MQRSELERFISEDLGAWDESSAIIPKINAKAVIIAKEDCIISGLSEASEIFGYFGLVAEPLFDEGEFVPSGSEVLHVRGNARKILQSERLALNFLARDERHPSTLDAGIAFFVRAPRIATYGWPVPARPLLGSDCTRRRQFSWGAATPTGSASQMQC